MIDTSARIRVEDFVLATPSEPTTQKQDLEEAVDNVFHKEMAQVQLALHQKRVQYFKALEAWAGRENDRQPGHLEFFKEQAAQHMHKYDQDLLWEREQQQRQLEYLRMCRMNELYNFLKANG